MPRPDLWTDAALLRHALHQLFSCEAKACRLFTELAQEYGAFGLAHLAHTVFDPRAQLLKLGKFNPHTSGYVARAFAD
jgi:hypothetical protein